MAFNFTVGKVVGTKIEKTETTEKRTYFEIAKADALQQIEEAISYWSDVTYAEGVTVTSSILIPKKGTDKIILSPRISNRVWAFVDEGSSRDKPLALELSSKEVAKALYELKEQTKDLTRNSQAGINLYKVFKATKNTRWAGYQKKTGVSIPDKQVDPKLHEKMYEQWWSQGGKNKAGTPLTMHPQPTQ